MGFQTFDIVCVVILVIMGLIGYGKGAISTLLDLVGLIASFLIAWTVAPMASTWLIANTGIQSSMTNFLTNLLVNNTATSALASSTSALTALGVSQEMVNQVIQGNVTEGIQAMMAPMAERVISLLVFLVLLLLAGIILGIIKGLFKKINAVPVLGFVNRLLGMGIGVVFGCGLSVVVVMAVYTYAVIAGDGNLLTTLTTGNITAVICRAFT